MTEMQKALVASVQDWLQIIDLDLDNGRATVGSIDNGVCVTLFATDENGELTKNAIEQCTVEVKCIYTRKGEST